MSNITVVIHTYNSAKEIEECITSAKLLTEHIVMVDMESRDETVAKAAKMGIDIKTFPHSNYVEPAREFGINQVETDWLFILDSDERITPELAMEIKTVTSITNSQLPATTYYKVPRKNIFGKKKWLQHGGWWPDHQIRLINKTYLKSWPTAIHSTPVIEGKMDFLKSTLLHYFHGDLENMVKKTIIFEDIESELLFKADKPVTTKIFFRKFLGELYRRLFKRQGFRDGTIGIIESIYQAFSKTITYLYLYEKKSRSV